VVPDGKIKLVMDGYQDDSFDPQSMATGLKQQINHDSNATIYESTNKVYTKVAVTEELIWFVIAGCSYAVGDDRCFVLY
jgi:hypothetical protein